MKKPIIDEEKFITFPSRGAWEKLIGRWASVGDCGEKRLLCAVIAEAIRHDYEKSQKNGNPIDSKDDLGFYFRGQFLKHAKWIGLDHEYLKDQVIVAIKSVGKELKA